MYLILRVRNAVTPSVLHVPESIAASRPATADLHAARLLQRALGTFQKWPETFRGFAASVRCDTPGGGATGRVMVRPGGVVEIHLDDAPASRWVEGVLRAISLQRTPRFFKDGDGRFRCTLHPDGDGVTIVRVLAAVDDLRTYWIDAKGRVRRRDRTARGLRTITTYRDLQRGNPGRVLPARSCHQVLRADSGAVLSTEEVEETHRRLAHVWLPDRHTTTVSRAGGVETLVLALHDHALL